MKNICIFGKPGSGKSTISSGLFYEMKMRDIEVEYCTEYAKELVYGEDFLKLNNQLMVLANQSHPWYIFDKKGLEFTINDGPFLLSLAYLSEESHLPKKQFCDLVVEMYKSYETVNYFLEPDFVHYQETGRIQNSEESEELSQKIKNILIEYGIPFKTITSNEETVNYILRDLEIIY